MVAVVRMDRVYPCGLTNKFSDERSESAATPCWVVLVFVLDGLDATEWLQKGSVSTPGFLFLRRNTRLLFEEKANDTRRGPNLRGVSELMSSADAGAADAPKCFE